MKTNNTNIVSVISSKSFYWFNSDKTDIGIMRSKI